MALLQERNLIQSEFKNICDKWENIENQINLYNKNLKINNPDLNSLDIIKEATKDFAPLTIFKSGKVQLNNRHIQRTFEKIRNAYKGKLLFQYYCAKVLLDYIEENKLSQYIEHYIKVYIESLLNNLAHNDKFSYIETGDPKKTNYNIYPPVEKEFNSTRDKELAHYFLFNDFETILRWMSREE